MDNSTILLLIGYAFLNFLFFFSLYKYVRVRKIPTDLKKYKKITIPSNGITIKEIGEKLLSSNNVIKLSIEGENLIFQDKITLSSTTWGKMYIVTTDDKNIFLYYRNTLGVYNFNKYDLREMKNIIEFIAYKKN